MRRNSHEFRQMRSNPGARGRTAHGFTSRAAPSLVHGTANVQRAVKPRMSIRMQPWWSLSRVGWRHATAWSSLVLASCAVGLDDDNSLYEGAGDPSFAFDAGPPDVFVPPVIEMPAPVFVPDAMVSVRDPTQFVMRDAGTSTFSPRDASSGLSEPGTSSPPSTRPASSGSSRPTSGCNERSCTNDCSLGGPFQCCTLLDTCGCTWAPGAYCL